MTTRFTTPALFPAATGTVPRPRHALRVLTAAMQRVAHTTASRRTLGDLDDRLLADSGMTRAAAAAAAARAPWDVIWLPPRGPRTPRGETPQPTPGNPGRGRRMAQFGAAARDWLAVAWRRRRSRQHIATLDAAALKDIGVTYAEAEHEANRPFWR